MRRKVFSVVLALVMALAAVPQAAIAAPGDVISFPDANFEAAVRVVIGKPTGAITKGDVAEVTELDVSERNIADLAGIEHFTDLKWLDCTDNQLTALDVSKNTALTVFGCGGNQLTTLEVSKNTALTWLGCFGNQLTALDVSKNTALTGLYCENSQLTALDVSKNTALESLFCGWNQLTILDIGKNTALISLHCRSNKLTALDVSKNMALDMLWCQDNQLTTLDVSKNTALIGLCCENNQLTVLDVSKNTALRELWCYNNYFPSKSAIIGLDESKLDVFEFIPQKSSVPNLSTASTWAADHIKLAYAKGFLPAELQNNYQVPITRGEFVRLAMSWLRYYTGQSDDELLASRGLTRGAFSDTADPVILAAAALGITAGVGNGNFGVDGQFNREQAAVMLANVFRILGEDTENAPEYGFTDIETASEWARGAINYAADTGVMAGVGGNRFDPRGTFSREQSIIVFNKMG